VDEITGKGASVVLVEEQYTYSRDTNDAIGRLRLNLLGAFAEFERTLIRERQREDIRLAQAAGKYKGRARSSQPSCCPRRGGSSSRGCRRRRLPGIFRLLAQRCIGLLLVVLA
jgi:DNA invertase Pin-like site-specific DNA recombinase